MHGGIDISGVLTHLPGDSEPNNESGTRKVNMKMTLIYMSDLSGPVMTWILNLSDKRDTMITRPISEIV